MLCLQEALRLIPSFDRQKCPSSLPTNRSMRTCYFSNVGGTLANRIIYNGNKTYIDYLPHVPHIFSFTSVNENYVLKLLSKLDSKYSSGHDGISTSMLKSLKHILCKPLTILINQTLKSGIFPDKLKISKGNTNI